MNFDNHIPGARRDEPTPANMTKRQVIRELQRRGWTDITLYGRFSIEATSPKGERGLYDPRDLLVEIISEESISR
jgi:hypothetical protein